MKPKKRLDWITALVSIAVTVMGTYFYISNVNRKDDDNIIESVLSVAVFLSLAVLCNFLLMRLIMKLRSNRLRVTVPKRNPVFPALCLLLIFAVGASGQFLYLLDRKTETHVENTSIVLLIDSSGSMESIRNSCNEAACSLIDDMDTSYTVKAMLFAGYIPSYSDDFENNFLQTNFTVMDDSGKKTVKNFILNESIAGGTDFSSPLKAAHKLLSVRTDHPAVIMLTDGDGYLDGTIEQQYISAGIKLSTIRIIDRYFSISPNIAQMAINTGGFDKEVYYNEDGSVDMADVLEAFHSALDAVTQTTQIFSEANVLLDAHSSPIKFVIQILMYILISILAGLMYYGKQNIGSVIINAALGAITALAVLFAGEASAFLMIGLCITGVITVYMIPGEKRDADVQ